MNEFFNKIRTLTDITKYNKIVLFGAGNTCVSVMKLLESEKIICIFDNDTQKWGNTIDGYEIKSPSKLVDIVDLETAIIISSVSYQYEIASELISKYKINEERIFSYTNKYCEENIYNIEKIKDNLENIERVIDLLQDKESKEYYKNCILSRLTRNPVYIKSNPNIKEPYQYGNLVCLKDGDEIIDCGAYIGDTAEIFLNKLNGECRVHCIEPFKNSYEELCNAVEVKMISDRVKCYHNAVSDNKRTDIIKCNIEYAHGSANLKDTQGIIENIINVDTLDNLFSDNNKVDYIKMDIEGEEVNALKGGANIIKKFKPRMMISAYHLIEHFWEIPILINQIEPKYKIYAGHQPNAPYEIEFYVTM